MLAGGGEAIGVIPQALVDREIAHRGLTELRVVASMHERKALMADLADGFVALPGGFGTLDELFEILTWPSSACTRKPIGLLDVEATGPAAGLAGARGGRRLVPADTADCCCGRRRSGRCSTPWPAPALAREVGHRGLEPFRWSRIPRAGTGVAGPSRAVRRHVHRQHELSAQRAG